MLTDKLRLIEPIGAGAMGSVWLAQDGELERQVAVKLMARALDDQAVARFRREANLAARIKSPHVVEIYGYGVSVDREPYIEMERLDGESLADRIRKGAMALSEVHEVVTQVGRALTAAHALGVVHRDIKPGNVFLVDAPGYDLFVKVVDFGIAKQRSDDANELTATGAIVGTPHYMSPEQLTSTKDVDHRADLWALGVMAYQMLTAQLPFRGDTIGAVSIAVSKGVFVPVSKALPAACGELDAWFERALRFDVDDRFASAAEMSAAFGAACRAVEDAPTIAQTESDIAEDASTAEFMAEQGLASEHAGELEPTPSSNDNTEQRASAHTAMGSSRRWQFAAGFMGLVALGLLVFGSSGPESSLIGKPSSERPAPSAPTSTAVASSVMSAVSAHAESDAPKPDGRLPPGYIQEVMRNHFDAFSSCIEMMPETRKSLMRTLRFVIQRDGSTRDVHIGELDPRTPELDACLVSKVKRIGFAPPEGGVVSISYPITFSDPSWEPLTDAACRMTPDCLHNGRCTLDGDRCGVKSDADCELARLCVRRGQCHAAGGRCVTGADGGPETPECKLYGLCALADGKARADRDEHCQGARVCEKFGACSARDGVCVATSNEACRRSSACNDEGSCTAYGDWCVAGFANDCERSKSCKQRGACTIRFFECVALRDEDCRKSSECKTLGRCSLKGGRCLATSEEDCKRSTSCTERGNCLLRGTQCAQPRR